MAGTAALRRRVKFSFIIHNSSFIISPDDIAQCRTAPLAWQNGAECARPRAQQLTSFKPHSISNRYPCHVAAAGTAALRHRANLVSSFIIHHS
jgi:hypothetical protein